MGKKSADSLINMCRTCMSSICHDKEESKQQCIYEKPLDCHEGPTIVELLQIVQPQIEVPVKDDLPKIMCIGCVQNLQITHDFLETYREANEKFHKLLKEVDLIGENYEPPPVEAQEFEDEVIFEGDKLHVARYEIEIEKMSIDSKKDTLDIEDEMETKNWPEFEEDPVHYMSDEDAGKAELFDNPYSDASDSDWTAKDINKRQATPRKCNSRSRHRNSPKAIKRRGFKAVKQETEIEELPPETEDGTISCQECESVFENITQWREHRREHRIAKKRNGQHKVGRPKKSYKCEHCEKVFSKITAYKNHVRIHTGEEPYLCIECGKSFKVVSSLNTHMLRHRGDKKFQCPHCPKKFVCSSGLYGHMMVHNKDKPYVCDICGSAFHMAYMLKKHNLYHKGIKNFPCEYCELRFVTAEKQRRHMRTHTGEKPYRCKYCDRAFAQSNDCNKHLKQHLGENIYQCELCPQRFPLARDLRVHFATHKDDDEETRARNLDARVAEENNLKIKLEIKKSVG